jgi:nucleoside-diphosphate-sugar epimerase
MITVAVTGANHPIGKALLERLDADRDVGRILAVDVSEPQMPVAKLEYRACDLRDRSLAGALEGADVVVHTALDPVPSRREEALFARNVHGTRNLLAAASKVGASRLVHLSSVSAYGAHADNPLPLSEDAPLRANPDYSPAYHALLAEELVADFAGTHPETRVVVLRAATPVGHRTESPITQHLEAPRLVGIRGSEAPLQFVHVDDLAAALHLAVGGDLEGAYNVAADGWLTSEELATVLAKRRLHVPETLAFAGLERLWRHGLWPAPPGMLNFLMHPTVVVTSKLHHAGWSPTRSNREVLREFAAERAGWVRLGALRFRRRSATLVAFGAAATAAGTVVRWLRRRR